MALWGTVDTLAAAPKVTTKTTSFDATDAAVVVLASNTIKLTSHSFITGDPVTYNDAGGTAIAGLTDAAIVYVNRVDADTIKLYGTKAQAVAGHASTGLKALTGVGVGAGHNFVKTPSDIYFVDTTEAGIAANRAKGLQTPGWNSYSTYTDGTGATRHKVETIVPMKVAAGTAGDVGVDGADDAVVADA